MSATNVTTELADGSAAVRYVDLPPKVVDRARVAIIDYFGCALAGVSSTPGRKILDYVSEFGARGGSSVIGTGLRLSPADAALANGTLGHALDYDDVQFQMIGHPGVTILPAVLAVGEWADMSVEDVVTAYVVGFETATRLGGLMNLPHYESGWHATGTLGTMGAAVGAARALGLPADGIARAIGTAASMAAGIRQNFGTDTKPFHAGRSAQNGATAALLASRGFTSADDSLGGQWGFVNVFSGGSPSDPCGLAARFGETWNIVDPGFATKVYPSCASTHTGIDSTLDLLAERGAIDAADVQSVRVGVVRLTPKILIHNSPRTGLEAKFSLQYCVARALISGRVTMPHFTDEAVNEPRVRDLMGRVEMYVEPEVDEPWQTDQPRPARLEVTLRSGEVLRGRADTPRGAPKRPVDEATLLHKYRDCASLAVGDEFIDRTTVRLLSIGKENFPVRDLTGAFELSDREMEE